MDTSTNQIAKLLNFTFNSDLSVEQIISKVNGVDRPRQETSFTLRTLFTRANMEKVCMGDDPKLITRILTSLRFALIGRHNWASGICDLPIADALMHRDFLEVQKWSNCGKKTWPLIYKMFDHAGINF